MSRELVANAGAHCHPSAAAIAAFAAAAVFGAGSKLAGEGCREAEGAALAAPLPGWRSADRP
eukprot:1148188-Pelagomonas_calceolata.AAC.2